MTGITDALGQTTTLSYTPQGFPASVTNSLGHTTTFTSNASGERTSMTDPLGNTWRFDYDDLGRLVEVTDPFDRVQRNEFDSVGRLIRVVQNYDPSRPRTTRTNSTSSLHTITTRSATSWRSRTRSVGSRADEYDAANRLVRTTDPFGNISQFTYDDTGNLTAVDRSAGAHHQLQLRRAEPHGLQHRPNGAGQHHRLQPGRDRRQHP